MVPPRHHDDASGPLAGLARLLEVDPGECPDAEIAEAVVALVGVADRVEHALLGWLRAFDGRLLHHADGSRSTGTWLAARAEISRTVANAKTHTANDLAHCPSLSAAFADGRIGAAKARAALTARATDPTLFAEHEARIVDEIAPLTVDQAHIVLHHWAQMAEALKHSRAGNNDDGAPDGGDGDPPNPHLANTLHLSTTFGGNVVGDLAFDPVAGAELTQAIAARVDHLYATGTFGPTDGLTPAARRAWALRTLITDGTQPTSLRGKPRPSISLLLDQRTAQGEPISDIEDLLSRRCDLTDGTPVPLRTAQRLLCDCTLTALVRKTLADGHIEIIGITDHQRTATPRQRIALAHRDGGCIFPGCHTPPERCHAHHIHWHEHGGPTLIDNLALVCSYHHHLIHEGNWRLTRHPATGQLQLAKPDGTPVPLTPPGQKIEPPDPPGSSDPPPPPRSAPPPGPRPSPSG